MAKYNTAYRLKEIMKERGLKQIDIIRLAQPYAQKYKTKIGRNDLSQYVSGKVTPGQSKLFILAKALGVNEAWLMGYDDVDRFNTSPDITDDYATFPVIGEIAASYDHIAEERWEGEKIDIPLSYLKGREQSDFFVLKVKGDSMYPAFQENDKVLILRQSTMNFSGQIGAVLYDSDYATLKKVEYKKGENWMRLVPINPTYPAKKITNGDLERCRILGIPQLLIRDLDE